MSNATRYDYRTACLAGIGRLLAFAGMIGLASAGLAVVLINGRKVAFSENVFYEYVDAKIAHVWSVIDKPAIEEQLNSTDHPHRGDPT